MTTNPFEGCWGRLERAATHREAASAEWNAFLDHEPYDFRLDVDDEGNGTLWLVQLEPVPPILGVLFGEYLYNLRAALDYCIYDVAVCDSKQDPPPGEGTLQFPIFSDEASFRRNEYRIKALSERHRKWVESVQPYRGDDGRGPEYRSLYWLNELGRRDRHRQLHVVGAYVSESAPMVRSSRSPVGVFFQDVDPYTFVEGEAVIARFLVEPFAPDDQVEANPNTALDVEILEIARQRPEDCEWLFFPLGKRLLLIESFVDAIVGRFERDCTGHTRSKFVAKETEIDGPAA